MRLKLQSDVFFTVGTGFRPVDLVSKSTKSRIGLSEDEAAVAMLLMEGAPAGETLLKLMQKHGVSWGLPELEEYLKKLEQAQLLERGAEAVEAGVDAPEPYEVGDTDIDRNFAPNDEDDETAVALVEQPEAVAPPRLGMFRQDLHERQLPDGNIEVSNPSTGQKQRFAPNTLRLAKLFDGMRTSDDIVASAQMAGLGASPAAVGRLAKMLQDHHLLTAPPQLTGPLPIAEIEQRQSKPAVPPPPPAVAPAAPRNKTPATAAEAPRHQAPIIHPPNPAPVVHPSAPPVTAAPPVAAAPPREAPPAHEHGNAESLAAALILLRDRHYLQARQLLQPLLDRNPNHLQAQTLLQLIEAEETRAGKAGRRRRLILLGVVGVLLLCCGGILFVPVTDEIELPCQASQIPRGTIKSNAEGRLDQLAITAGAVLSKGQLVAVVVDEIAQFKMKLIDRRLDSFADLLRLMKTGGTDDDDKNQRALVKSLNKKLKKLRCNGGDKRCAAELASLKEELRIAKLKVRHCEWQAYPDEIAAVEKSVTETKALRAKLEKESRHEIRASQAGRVSELQKPKTVQPGVVLAQLSDANNFTVKFAHQTIKPGSSIAITLGKDSAFQTFVGKVSSRQGDAVQVDVSADVGKVDFGSSCRAKLSERMILIKKLLR